MFIFYPVVSGLYHIFNKKKDRDWEGYVVTDISFLMFVHSSFFLFFKYSY